MNHANSILSGSVPQLRLSAVADIRQCRRIYEAGQGNE